VLVVMRGGNSGTRFGGRSWGVWEGGTCIVLEGGGGSWFISHKVRDERGVASKRFVRRGRDVGVRFAPTCLHIGSLANPIHLLCNGSCKSIVQLTATISSSSETMPTHHVHVPNLDHLMTAFQPHSYQLAPSLERI